MKRPLSVMCIALTAALFGVVAGCKPQQGMITETPTPVAQISSAGIQEVAAPTAPGDEREATVFVNDLPLTEGDAVKISRKSCYPPDQKPWVQKCKVEAVGSGRVIRVDAQTGYGTVLVPPGTREGDQITTTRK